MYPRIFEKLLSKFPSNLIKLTEFSAAVFLKVNNSGVFQTISAEIAETFVSVSKATEISSRMFSFSEIYFFG